MRQALLQLALMVDGYAGVAVVGAALGALAPALWLAVDLATGAAAVGLAVAVAFVLAVLIPALVLHLALPRREDRIALAKSRHHAAQDHAQQL